MKADRNHMHEKFAADLASQTDAELIASFNRQVGNKGWTSSRASYLAALRKEFERRNFDFSAISNTDSLSFRTKIRLVGKTVRADQAGPSAQNS